ncbi:hypothetical protein PFISCL1PPCAC_2727, partial [Pristionchus fissidentatus]
HLFLLIFNLHILYPSTVLSTPHCLLYPTHCSTQQFSLPISRSIQLIPETHTSESLLLREIFGVDETSSREFVNLRLLGWVFHLHDHGRSEEGHDEQEFVLVATRHREELLKGTADVLILVTAFGCRRGDEGTVDDVIEGHWERKRRGNGERDEWREEMGRDGD